MRPRRALGSARRLLAAVGVGSALLSGCGASAPAVTTPQALERYVREVEPLRLAVNRLLEGADPILAAFHDHALSPSRAAAQMRALEQRFGNYAVDVLAIKPQLPALAELHALYAETYVLEDSYLTALWLGLAKADFVGLPDTQNQQRAAIIRWRIGLEVLARSARVVLPRDLHSAGRGEIAPAPEGGS